MSERLIIANCSGFYGDRFSAMEEVVRGGPVDVVTGDYLAELTMAILYRQRAGGRSGYVPTFLRQLERVLVECIGRGIRIVANAGGLDPRGLAQAIRELADKLGVKLTVAHVEGDDLLPRVSELQALGEPLAHMDRGIALADSGAVAVTANAYLGGWGIREALVRGADIVVCGRVTDAALVVGPAAWRFEWSRDDWDALAGAVAAGHVIECSTQATGGNYAFFEEVRAWDAMGFPLVEMARDGSFVVTKHPGTGGLVSVGTVTAQLLYEIRGARYANPDVISRFDSLRVEQTGPDRVRVSGARGEPPPARTKVAVNTLGGFRNSVTVLLAGLDIEAKAQLVEHAVETAVGGRAQFATWDTRLSRSDHADPASNEDAIASLRLTVMSPDAERVGRMFSSAVVAVALSSAPGFALTAPPADALPYVVYWPALVGNQHVRQEVFVGDERVSIEPLAGQEFVEAITASATPAPAHVTEGPTMRLPLGRLFGARSGDKGGNANLGVWARDDASHEFLRAFLTTERLKQLLPDMAALTIERHELPNLRALNFWIQGVLGEGVASSVRTDPQGKTLGEYLRARWIEVPEALAVSR